MKTTHKIIKYLAFALAIAIIAGIVTSLMAVFGGLSGLNYSFSGSKTDAEKIFNGNEDSILYIEIAASKLNIHEGDALLGVTDDEYITVEVRGSKLVAIEKSHSAVNKDDTYLDITIPADYVFEKIVIITGAGTVQADALRADKFDLTLGAGEVTINYLAVNKEADIEGGVGELTVKDGEINNLDAEMGVGKASIRASINGESDLETGVGDFELTLLGGKESYKFDASTGIGDCRIGDEKIVGEKTIGSGKNKIDIDCGIGSVNVYFE
ncbi:MAG: DUF4097 family beta strand repeat protein [Oscillospiraceae bacterium]|nr:DUF4097 family beta strand repeat protein [Oscillospiraceae bacterium]